MAEDDERELPRVWINIRPASDWAVFVDLINRRLGWPVT